MATLEKDTQPLQLTALQHNGRRLSKGELLTQWARLEPSQDPVAYMRPIVGEGSSYGGDGIRISGSDEFVSAVLSRLKDMLVLENNMVRLAASHSIVEPKEINGERKDWKYAGGNVVYIQLQHRGSCGIGIGDEEATEEYIDRVPGLRAKVQRGQVAWLMFLGMSQADAESRVYKK